MWDARTDDRDLLVTACRSRLVEAYDRWMKINGRAKRTERSVGQKDAAKRFVNEIWARLELSGEEVPSRLRLPSTRSGWSNWRTGRSSPTLNISLGVCRAILNMTGIDVSHEQKIKNMPTNSSDLVWLGPVYVLQQSDKEDGMGEIIIESVTFRVSRSKPLRVADTQIRSSDGNRRHNLGTYRYALRQASIFVENASDLQPILKNFSGVFSSDQKSGPGVDIILDSDRPSHWIVQPTFPREALQARLDNVKLCASDDRDMIDKAVISISVDPLDIITNFTFDSATEPTDLKVQKIKRRLIEHLIRMAIFDADGESRLILSATRVRRL